MEENKTNQKMDWRPVIFFYVKTTSWIVFPAILAMFVKSYFQGAKLFFLMIVAFGITCFGIYKEIKNYKLSLDKKNDGK